MMSDPLNPKDAIAARKPRILSVVPPVSIEHEAAAMEWGAYRAGDKGTGYGPFNWRATPVRLSVYVDAICRHLFAYWAGEERASDSKVTHLGHIKAGCGILLDAAAHGTLIDDRPTHPGNPIFDAVEEHCDGVARGYDSRTTTVRHEPPTVSAEHDGVARELDRSAERINPLGPSATYQRGVDRKHARRLWPSKWSGPVK